MPNMEHLAARDDYIDFDVRFHYNRKWVRTISGQGCMTFGRNLYFVYRRDQITERFMKHELKHVEQYSRLRLFGWWWISIPPWLFLYFCQWIAAGFRYSNIRFEREARAAETID